MPMSPPPSTRTTPGEEKVFFTKYWISNSRQSLFKEHGVKLAFVATRSGLTRWEEYLDEHLEEDYEDEAGSIQEP